MIAGQKSIGSNGYENLLFPLEYMNISQGENGRYSHQGTYAIDFLGWGANGRVYKCPYYAPCTCFLKRIFGSSSPMLVWQSSQPVNYIDGSLDYVLIGVAHDNDTPNFKVGETRNQGDVLGHTGTYGYVTGDHVHIEIAKGTDASFFKNSSGVWQFKNEYHDYLAMGVNDTIIVNGYGYNWKSFGTPTPPAPPTPIITKKEKFPWQIVQFRKKYR